MALLGGTWGCLGGKSWKKVGKLGPEEPLIGAASQAKAIGAKLSVPAALLELFFFRKIQGVGSPRHVSGSGSYLRKESWIRPMDGFSETAMNHVGFVRKEQPCTWG